MRINAGLTQQQAADVVYSGLRTWQQWEAGDRRMHPAIFDYFLLKTGQKELIRTGQQESTTTCQKSDR